MIFLVMTQTGQNAKPSDFSVGLANEIEFYGDRAFQMSRGHRKAAGSFEALNMLLGLPAAILASISGVSAFTNNPRIAGITAFSVAGLTGATSFLNPSARQQLHLEAANALETWSTKSYLLVKKSRANIIEINQMIKDWENLMNARDQINKQSPLLPSWAQSKRLKKLMDPYYLQ